MPTLFTPNLFENILHLLLLPFDDLKAYGLNFAWARKSKYSISKPILNIFQNDLSKVFLNPIKFVPK